MHFFYRNGLKISCFCNESNIEETEAKGGAQSTILNHNSVKLAPKIKFDVSNSLILIIF